MQKNKYIQLLEWGRNNPKGVKSAELETKLQELGFDFKRVSGPTFYNFLTKDIFYRYETEDKFLLTFEAYFQLSEHERLEEARKESKFAKKIAIISIILTLLFSIASTVIGVLQLLKMYD